MDLASIIVKSKTVEMEYPGCPDFNISVAYLTRDELMKLRERCTTQKFNKKSRQPEEEVDNELFQDLYIEAVVKGWTGLKYKYVLNMIPVDPATIENVEDDLEFTASNANVLMKNCSDFDSWISTQLEDVGNFTKDS